MFFTVTPEYSFQKTKSFACETFAQDEELFVWQERNFLSNKKPENLYSQGFPVHIILCVRGFEPPTFWSVAKRSIQLS